MEPVCKRRVSGGLQSSRHFDNMEKWEPKDQEPKFTHKL